VRSAASLSYRSSEQEQPEPHWPARVLHSPEPERPGLRWLVPPEPELQPPARELPELPVPELQLPEPQRRRECPQRSEFPSYQSQEPLRVQEQPSEPCSEPAWAPEPN